MHTPEAYVSRGELLNITSLALISDVSQCGVTAFSCMITGAVSILLPEVVGILLHDNSSCWHSPALQCGLSTLNCLGTLAVGALSPDNVNVKSNNCLIETIRG